MPDFRGNDLEAAIAEACACIDAAERIVDSRRKGHKVEYLVKWAGYSAEHNTWEPKVNILDKRLIDNFQR